MASMRRASLVALSCLSAGAASAHSLSVTHIDVRPGTGGHGLDVEVDVALRDVALTLPLDGNGDDRITWGELQAAEPAIRDWVSDGVRLSDRGGACPLVPARMAVRHYDDGTYASLRFHARCDVGQLRLDYSLLFAQDPQHRALATVRTAEGTRTAILTGDARKVSLRSDAPQPFAAFVREGWSHILGGYDHLAFLLCLLLPAALVRSQGHWSPVPSARAGMWQAIGLASSFTLAHSITLSLAALGWVTPASRWIELGIAASILAAAINLVWPVLQRRLWLVTFGFGLVHGFGFAGALLELGLPSQSRLAALLGFNVGVELGQLGAILLVFPFLLLARDQRWYVRVLLPLAATAIGLLASRWLWQRLAG